MVQLSHPYMTTGKTVGFTRWTLVGKVMSLLFNMLSRLVIAFLPRSKRLLISWLQALSAVIFGGEENKVCHCFHCFPSICQEVMVLDALILVFRMLSFKPAFSLPSFTFIKRLFSSSLLSAVREMSSAYLRLLLFLPAILIPACASFSPVFLMMYSAYKLNKQGDNTALTYSFPNLESVHSMSSANCCFLTCIQISQERGHMAWYFHVFKNFPQFVVIHTVKGFGVINKAVDVFL